MQSNLMEMEPTTESATPAPPEITSFEQLDLSPVMLRALKKLGYETPSPVQAQVIPPALESSDIIAQARTGTGKTAAFGIPILELLDPLRETRNPQALIMVPTRELAEQVFQEIERLAQGCPTALTVLAGGKHMRRQMQQLSDGTQIVVGTPGRVMDHIQRGTFRTDDLWCVVLDEADRMLDIGFRPAIERILRRCPTDRQTMLLSATMPTGIQRLIDRYLQNPVRVNCSTGNVSVETIEQRYFSLRLDEKFDTLVKLLLREEPKQAIIFCRTKRGTDRLCLELQKEFRHHASMAKVRLDCIHGDMNQRDRDRVFQSLRDGTLQILVATDVVGRGIDVSTVSHIINFDIPLDCDDYVHRVGRTGRMGRDGIAFTFVTAAEGPQLTAIELNINRLLIRDSIEHGPEMPASSSPRPVLDVAEVDEDLDVTDDGQELEPAAPALPPREFGVASTGPTQDQPKKRRLFPVRRKNPERVAKLKEKPE